MAPLALEVDHGIHHVLEHARPGDLPLLGDVADQHDGGPGRLGVADHRLRRGAHLGDRAGGRIGEIGPQRLDGIEDHQVGAAAVGERRQYVLDIGFRGELDRGCGHAEPLRPEPDLGDGFLS